MNPESELPIINAFQRWMDIPENITGIAEISGKHTIDYAFCMSLCMSFRAGYIERDKMEESKK